MGDFKKLRVWQEAKDLTVFIYNVTREGEFAKDFGLKDQIQRAAVSIASNIAEGEGMKTDNHNKHFLYIAKGSSSEVMTQAIIANEIGYISEETRNHIESKCDYISVMLFKLIQSKNRKS